MITLDTVILQSLIENESKGGYLIFDASFQPMIINPEKFPQTGRDLNNCKIDFRKFMESFFKVSIHEIRVDKINGLTPGIVVLDIVNPEV